MALEEWPPGIGDRTPPHERERTSRFNSSLADTTKALEDELRKLDPEDWSVETGSGGGYTKSNGMPKSKANPDDPGFVLRWRKDGEQHAVGCDDYVRLKSNAREVYLWFKETRMRGDRPVKTGSANFAAAALPPGEEEEAAQEAVVLNQPWHEVLGISEDASDRLIKTAIQEKLKQTHPDQGGSREEHERVKIARKRAPVDVGNGG